MRKEVQQVGLIEGVHDDFLYSTIWPRRCRRATCRWRASIVVVACLSSSPQLRTCSRCCCSSLRCRRASRRRAAILVSRARRSLSWTSVCSWLPSPVATRDEQNEPKYVGLDTAETSGGINPDAWLPRSCAQARRSSTTRIARSRRRIRSRAAAGGTRPIFWQSCSTKVPIEPWASANGNWWLCMVRPSGRGARSARTSTVIQSMLRFWLHQAGPRWALGPYATTW